MLVTFTAKAASEMKSRLINYPDINRSQINSLVTGTFHSLFYRILCSSLSTKMEWELLLSKEWQRGQILKGSRKRTSLR